MTQEFRKAKPGTVIHDTHRTQDLIPAFLMTFRALDSPHYTAYVMRTFPAIPEEAEGNDDHEFWNSEEAQHLTHELFDALNDHAPDGYYFGAHEGDGSNFGFWPAYPEQCLVCGSEDLAIGICEDCGTVH